MAPIAAAGLWADMSVPVNVYDFPAQPEAAVTAKINADVGNDIRWDIIMSTIQEIAPAPPRHVTPVMKLGLPLKSKQEVSEDSTSAGETTDSDFSISDADSPKAGIRPPPGLCLPAAPAMQPPPGLSGAVPPPGLGDMPPPPGFEFP